MMLDAETIGAAAHSLRRHPAISRLGTVVLERLIRGLRLSIPFHQGAEIPGEHPRLEGDGRVVRTVRFSHLADLEAGRADLEAVIRAWCDWKAGPPGRDDPRATAVPEPA